MPGKIDRDEARKMHSEGASDTDIARRFGVTQSGATRWRQKQGLQPNIIAPPSLTPEHHRKARKMFREGATVEQVARALGCSTVTANKLRKPLRGDPRLRGHGITLQAEQRMARRDALAIVNELKAATRRINDGSIRDDTIGEMFLALMEGRLQRDQIKNEARRYSGRQVGLWQSPWAPASIDEDLNAEGFTLADLIPCPTAAAWLESVGA
ncbi:hypothetical protein [Novosphingobium subterraneum]|uniref:Resolvase HTH domain-containing protein n=1 Tax=Novosphingobium subterraneum TaxID=48936 RepID=A0A0B9A248_9SPHN|nr:hypothetical protein [Novosphingobium subterraneum]KHS43402.1 hypothetical protein NJ75_03711 [Novosphingobium subterraneum]